MDEDTNDKPRLGLALGGGAVRGAAHIGALKALEEQALVPDLLSGTSIGALVAALYAFGMKTDDIRGLALKMNWFDVSKLTLSKYGLLSNENMGNTIREQFGDIKIEDSPIPLALVATDISTGEKVVIKKGDVASAIMASSCIPGFFVPVTISDRILVDGGIVENVPISPLKEMGANYIVGVDLNGYHKYDRPESFSDVLFNAMDIAVYKQAEVQERVADLIIRMELSQYSRTDPKNVWEIYAEGYRTTVLSVKEMQSGLKKSVSSPLKLVERKLRQWRDN